MRPMTGHLLCSSMHLGPGLEITSCGYTVTLRPSAISPVTSAVGTDTCLMNDDDDIHVIKDYICYSSNNNFMSFIGSTHKSLLQFHDVVPFIFHSHFRIEEIKASGG